MKTPEHWQIDFAVEWLNYNDGEGDEGESCKAVAEWLKQYSDQKYERQLARENNVPVGKLRQYLSRKG